MLRRCTTEPGCERTSSASKGVGTAAGSEAPTPDQLGLLELTMFQKRIQGSIYGMMAPSKDVPRLLRLWQNDRLRVEEMLTRTYSLDEINQGYADMHAGLNIRGALTFGEPLRTTPASAAREALSTTPASAAREALSTP